jgi:hypothetical protein
MGKRATKSNRVRGNPEDAAAVLAEAFQGHPANNVVEITESLREHSVLAGLARLLCFVVWDENDLVERLAERRRKLEDLKQGGVKIRFDMRTRLASNEAGSQLYIEDGDQSVDLAAFPCVDPTKDSVPLGRVVTVEYWAAKQHLGVEDKTAGPYTHDFAEEWIESNRGGEVPLAVFPVLIYDVMNSRMSLSGGIYHIDLDMNDGKHSAGLRD